VRVTREDRKAYVVNLSKKRYYLFLTREKTNIIIDGVSLYEPDDPGQKHEVG
jgi:hypothetical protein